MPNLVVLFGPPASGKVAIGDELATLTGCRFFHNHLTVDTEVLAPDLAAARIAEAFQLLPHA